MLARPCQGFVFRTRLYEGMKVWRVLLRRDPLYLGIFVDVGAAQACQANDMTAGAAMKWATKP